MVARQACSCCGKKSFNTNVKSCTRCRIAAYCDTDCQKQHWKTHKAMCKSSSELLAKIKDYEKTKAPKLLKQWQEQAIEGKFLYFLITEQVGKETLLMITEAPEEHAVVIDLQFDFNHQTFVPTQPASVVQVKMLEGLGKEKRDELLLEIENAKFDKRNNNDEAAVGVILTYDGSIVSLFTIVTPFTDAAGHTWENTLALQYSGPSEIKLESSKFDTWGKHAFENLQVQVKRGLKTHYSYETFLANALRLGTKESRHQTHVVQVFMEFGFGLGEIKNITEYKVVPLETMHKYIDESKTFTNEQKKHLKSYELNLSSDSEWVVDARRETPSAVMAPVVFCGGKLIYIECLLIDFKKYYPSEVARCDETVHYAFRQLQEWVKGMEMPPVESPAVPTK